MSNGGISDDEQQHIGLARQLIYVIPFFAGLVTICVGLLADFLNWTNGPFALLITLIVNSILAGMGSAFLVARLHAVERGKWWRAGTSFLFAAVMTVAATVFWGMLAGCAGIAWQM